MMRNTEGYPDPTAGMALRNIEQEERSEHLGYMPLTYICLPDDECLPGEAKRYCAFALSKGALPIAPCLLFPPCLLDDASDEDQELRLHMSLILLAHCREAWYFGDVVDKDMRTVLLRASHRDMIVRRFTSDCREVDAFDLQANIRGIQS